MVVVLQQPKLIYIQEPRTGTRSTHRWLCDCLGGVYPWAAKGHITKAGVNWHPLRHAGPAVLKQSAAKGKLVPQLASLRDEIDQYQFFAVSRNPFDVVVTFFVDNRRPDHPTPKKLPQQIARQSKDLLDYLLTINNRIPRHVCDDENMARMKGVDHVLRYEDDYPDSLFRFLIEHGANIPPSTMDKFPRMGTTGGKRRDWRSYYCNESRKLVEQLYARYLKRFNYSFDS